MRITVTLVGATALLCLALGVNLRHQGELGKSSAVPKQNAPVTAQAPVSSHMQATDDPAAQKFSRATAAEIAHLSPAARAGNPQAQFQMGMAYETGHGARQSCIQGADWMKKAADQDYAPAEYNLALRYWDGDGVWANRAESLRWLNRAARQGHAQAIALKNALTSAPGNTPSASNHKS